jgi:hypothetical protein
VPRYASRQKGQPYKMPTISGKALISETTEKVIRRAAVIASATILVKLYDVPLNDLKVLGMDLPPQLFDVALLVLVAYHIYALLINWIGDLAAFRLWFKESSVWSDFGSNMKLDKSFLQGAIPLMLRLHHMEKGLAWPENLAAMDEETKRDLRDFKTNVELYTARLDYAGTRFSALNWFGRYYVWVQSFIFPMALLAWATYLLLKFGTFELPHRL